MNSQTLTLNILNKIKIVFNIIKISQTENF